MGGRLQKKRPLYVKSGVGGIKQMPSFQQRSSGMKSSSSVRFTIHFRNDAVVLDGKTAPQPPVQMYVCDGSVCVNFLSKTTEFVP